MSSEGTVPALGILVSSVASYRKDMMKLILEMFPCEVNLVCKSYKDEKKDEINLNFEKIHDAAKAKEQCWHCSAANHLQIMSFTTINDTRKHKKVLRFC